MLYYKWVYVPYFLLFRHFQRRVAERFSALDEMMQLYGSFRKQYTTPKNKEKRKSKGLVWYISLPLPPPVPLAFQHVSEASNEQPTSAVLVYRVTAIQNCHRPRLRASWNLSRDCCYSRQIHTSTRITLRASCSSHRPGRKRIFRFSIILAFRR